MAENLARQSQDQVEKVKMQVAARVDPITTEVEKETTEMVNQAKQAVRRFNRR